MMATATSFAHSWCLTVPTCICQHISCRPVDVCSCFPQNQRVCINFDLRISPKKKLGVLHSAAAAHVLITVVQHTTSGWPFCSSKRDKSSKEASQNPSLKAIMAMPQPRETSVGLVLDVTVTYTKMLTCMHLFADSYCPPSWYPSPIHYWARKVVICNTVLSASWGGTQPWNVWYCSSQ